MESSGGLFDTNMGRGRWQILYFSFAFCCLVTLFCGCGDGQRHRKNIQQSKRSAIQNVGFLNVLLADSRAPLWAPVSYEFCPDAINMRGMLALLGQTFSTLLNPPPPDTGADRAAVPFVWGAKVCEIENKCVQNWTQH